jgi:hypothetical protein
MITNLKKLAGIIFLMCCLTANGQSVKRGFKSLGKLEYDKAYSSFNEALSQDKDNIAANFGIALVLADDSSSRFDIINAWQYIERIEGKMGTLSQEEIEIITAYFLESEVDKSSRPVKKKIENALDAIETRLIKYIREENNLEAVYEVLSRYPNFRHYDNIVHIRNQFEFRKYEKQNTIEAYDEFISKFPDAAQIEKAKSNRNHLAFEKAKSLNTTNAYTTYITQFPESEYLQSALKLRNAAAFADAGKINTLESYESFVHDYPDALEVHEAKTKQQNILYEKAKRVKSLQAYNDFIKKYPEGQYFIDIFNLKATELGTQFVREQNITNPALLWAKGYDNNGRLESGGAVTVSDLNEYYIACNTRENDTAYTDAWVIKLDVLGKMIWNKTIGQSFDDRICDVLLDSKKNLIVVGYTWLSADSASQMGWMFKLGSDGKKIWNKNLGKLKINACVIDDNDRIYIGGSAEKDTLGEQYLITIFNSDAQKIGERAYTGRGEVNDLLITADGNLLVCGSNWIALMDSKRYLHWDVNIDTSLTVTKCAINQTGEFYFAGSNKKTIMYAKYTPQGKKLWFQNFDKADINQFISDISVIQMDNLIVVEPKYQGGKIKTFSKDGTLTGTKELIGSITDSRVFSEKSGITMLLSNGDLIFLKFSGLASL